MLVLNEMDALTQYRGLMQFLVQNHQKPVTDSPQSKRTLEDHVVKVVCARERKKGKVKVIEGTGFLVTEGGFLVTAHHVIRDQEEIWNTICRRTPPDYEGSWLPWLRNYGADNYVVYQGKQYPIDITLWHDDAVHDVVVLKAVMHTHPRARQLQEVSRTTELTQSGFWDRQNRPVPLLHRYHEGQDHLVRNKFVEIYGLKEYVQRRSGRITYLDREARFDKQIVRNAFLTDVDIEHGYSGSPVVDDQGYCVGMTSYLIPPIDATGRVIRGDHNHGLAGCIPFQYIARVLKSVADDLEEQTRAMRR
ncbi:TPA: trypsin-like peptidase domain-containing protein [Candidatus Woesearchaeota archaeon]|nr:trypsin-like peptidase domain-containing protein [Candidatus Woesearchaeota archaeon]